VSAASTADHAKTFGTPSQNFQPPKSCLTHQSTCSHSCTTSPIMNLFALELPPIGAGYDAPFSASSRFPSSSYPQTTRNDIERACGPNRLGRISESLRVFLARMTWVARILYIDTKDVLKLLACGRLGRQAAGHSWSALRVAKSCRKTA
jgi:hypothetical protein